MSTGIKTKYGMLYKAKFFNPFHTYEDRYKALKSKLKKRGNMWIYNDITGIPGLNDSNMEQFIKDWLKPYE